MYFKPFIRQSEEALSMTHKGMLLAAAIDSGLLKTDGKGNVSKDDGAIFEKFYDLVTDYRCKMLKEK